MWREVRDGVRDRVVVKPSLLLWFMEPAPAGGGGLRDRGRGPRTRGRRRRRGGGSGAAAAAVACPLLVWGASHPQVSESK